MILVGDAAHPMPPYLGQRTAMALEDAIALGVVLEEGLAPSLIEERLKLFSRVRHERVTAIQEFVRGYDEQDVWESGFGRDGRSFGTLFARYILLTRSRCSITYDLL